MSEQYDEQYEDIEFREIDRTKKVRKKKNYMARFLILAGAAAAIFLFLASGIFDVKNIEVTGNRYYSDKEVINLGLVKTGENIFWDTDIGKIEDNLMKDPYFAEVKVRRKLPSGISIEVKERRQTAAVVYGDSYIVIDKDGVVLRKSTVDPKVSLLTGLTVSRMNVGEKLEAEEKATLATTLNTLDAMTDGDIYFKKIDVSGIVLRAYIYDTLVVKGTAKQIQNAIESGNLQKVVNNLLKNDTTRGTIHLGDHNYMPFSPEFE